MIQNDYIFIIYKTDKNQNKVTFIQKDTTRRWSSPLPNSLREELLDLRFESNGDADSFLIPDSLSEYKVFNVLIKLGYSWDKVTTRYFIKEYPKSWIIYNPNK